MNNRNRDEGGRERLLGRITALLSVVVIALAVTFFFYASSFWITLLLSGLLAILVKPLVARLERPHIPRSVAATLVTVFGVLPVSATLWVF
jgi:predicted PurR-regulated permease PerM